MEQKSISSNTEFQSSFSVLPPNTSLIKTTTKCPSSSPILTAPIESTSFQMPATTHRKVTKTARLTPYVHPSVANAPTPVAVNNNSGLLETSYLPNWTQLLPDANGMYAADAGIINTLTTVGAGRVAPQLLPKSTVLPTVSKVTKVLPLPKPSQKQKVPLIPKGSPVSKAPLVPLLPKSPLVPLSKKISAFPKGQPIPKLSPALSAPPLQSVKKLSPVISKKISNATKVQPLPNMLLAPKLSPVISVPPIKSVANVPLITNISLVPQFLPVSKVSPVTKAQPVTETKTSLVALKPKVQGVTKINSHVPNTAPNTKKPLALLKPKVSEVPKLTLDTKKSLVPLKAKLTSATKMSQAPNTKKPLVLLKPKVSPIPLVPGASLAAKVKPMPNMLQAPKLSPVPLVPPIQSVPNVPLLTNVSLVQQMPRVPPGTIITQIPPIPPVTVISQVPLKQEGLPIVPKIQPEPQRSAVQLIPTGPTAAKNTPSDIEKNPFSMVTLKKCLLQPLNATATATNDTTSVVAIAAASVPSNPSPDGIKSTYISINTSGTNAIAGSAITGSGAPTVVPTSNTVQHVRYLKLRKTLTGAIEAIDDNSNNGVTTVVASSNTVQPAKYYKLSTATTGAFQAIDANLINGATTANRPNATPSTVGATSSTWNIAKNSVTINGTGGITNCAITTCDPTTGLITANRPIATSSTIRTITSTTNIAESSTTGTTRGAIATLDPTTGLITYSPTATACATSSTISTTTSSSKITTSGITANGTSGTTIAAVPAAYRPTSATSSTIGTTTSTIASGGGVTVNSSTTCSTSLLKNGTTKKDKAIKSVTRTIKKQSPQQKSILLKLPKGARIINAMPPNIDPKFFNMKPLTSPWNYTLFELLMESLKVLDDNLNKSLDLALEGNANNNDKMQE